MKLLTLSAVIFQREPDCLCSEPAALQSVGCRGAVDEFRSGVCPPDSTPVTIPVDFLAARPGRGRALPAPPARQERALQPRETRPWNSHSKGSDAPPAASVAFSRSHRLGKTSAVLSRGAAISFFPPQLERTEVVSLSLSLQQVFSQRKKKVKQNYVKLTEHGKTPKKPQKNPHIKMHLYMV